MGQRNHYGNLYIYIYIFLLRVDIQFCSVTQLCSTLCNPMDCSTPGLPVHHHSWSLPKPMSIELMRPSNHLLLCQPLLLPSIFPSIRVFSNESALHIRWPKYCSFSFNTVHQSTPKADLLQDGLAGSPCCSMESQGSSPTPQFKSINSSALSFLYSPTLRSYMTTGKTIGLTRGTSVAKVMSLLFNMLCRLVITFLPRSNHLLISWVQSPSAVIVEPKKNKISYCFHCFSIYLP